MNVPNLLDILPSDAEIEESNRLFEACGDNHVWVEADNDSPFYKRCTRCGGAEGIKMLNGFL